MLRLVADGSRYLFVELELSASPGPSAELEFCRGLPWWHGGTAYCHGDDADPFECTRIHLNGDVLSGAVPVQKAPDALR